MKRSILLLIGLMNFALGAYAQTKTFRLTSKAGKIYIDLGRAIIEGHGGKELVFSAEAKAVQVDEKAKGLKAINGQGLEDNTGLGLSVTEVNGVVRVSQMKSADPSNIKILVPYGMIISFDHQSKFGKAVYFKNIQGEIEVSTSENSIHLENVTGPVSIKTVQGNVEAILPLNVKGPVSIVSIYGNVDVALPQATRSTVKLNAKLGEILVAEEFQLEIQKQEPQPRYTNQITGKLNGGGFAMDLRSDNGKIYLRAK
jgi:predicted membrane protein